MGGITRLISTFVVCFGLISPIVHAAAVPAAATPAHFIETQWPGNGYGGPAPQYGQEWDGRREHCMRLRDRLREIRYRMESGRYWDRDRLESRFHELRERLRHECWGHWREE